MADITVTDKYMIDKINTSKNLVYFADLYRLDDINKLEELAKKELGKATATKIAIKAKEKIRVKNPSEEALTKEKGTYKYKKKHVNFIINRIQYLKSLLREIKKYRNLSFTGQC